MKRFNPKLLCFNCDAGGMVLDEEMLRETLKGAQNVRQVDDPVAAGWLWRASQEVIDAFKASAELSTEFEIYRELPIKADSLAKNSVYLVDRDGMVAGLIANLGIPELGVIPWAHGGLTGAKVPQ